MMVLEDLSVRGRLHDVTLSVGAGEFVGLIGPNGAGKTTLLRSALGLAPATGQSSLARMCPHDRARAVAFLPQEREVAWPMTVEALVGLGRHAWRGQDGGAAVARAMDSLHLGPLRHRVATELSGGELARTLIARALAQETPLLLADEPAAGLDPAMQIATMTLFAGLARGGRAVVASLHDLGLAARHCTRLVVLNGGRVVADGPPTQVLRPDLLAQVFGIRAHLAHGPEGVIFQPLDLAGEEQDGPPPDTDRDTHRR